MRPYAAIFTLMISAMPGVAMAEGATAPMAWEPLPSAPVMEPLYPSQTDARAMMAPARAMVPDRVSPQRSQMLPVGRAYYEPSSRVSETPAPQPSRYVQSTPMMAPGTPFTLPGNTAISLRLQYSLNSRNLRRGEGIPLIVSRDVLLDGHIVVPRGTLAVGEIVTASRSGGFGKGGKIEIAAKSFTLNGRAVELSGSLEEKGRGSGAGRILLFGALAGAVGLAILHGDDAVISSDTTFPATTRGDETFN